MHQWTKSGGLNSTEQSFLLPTNQPRVPIQAPPRFFRITALRSNPSSAKQWISQMQLAVTSRAKYVLQKMSKERNPESDQERPKLKKNLTISEAAYLFIDVSLAEREIFNDFANSEKQVRPKQNG